MNKHKEQMPVKYKRLDSGRVAVFYFERSLDLIFSPGCFTVEIDHSGKDVGLPIDDCGEEHYFVGNLVVTDNGTAGHKQENRVTGQQLTITSRKGKETKVFTRTYADGVWSLWRSLACTGMYNNISTTDELLATVESLVNENTHAKEVEESVKRAAVDISSLTCTTDKENVTVTGKSMDGEIVHSVEIPVATTESAGVMSAEDKESIIMQDKAVVEKHTLGGLFATASPKISGTSTLTYKSDYIPIQKGYEYHIKATKLSLVNGWIQIGTTTEIPAANVAINNVVKYMDSTDKDVDMVYKSDIDGYLVCFYQGEQGYLFEKTVFRHIVPILTEKVEAIEDTVSSYNDAIYEREDVALDGTVLSTLFLTTESTTILQTTDSAYQLSYSRVEKGKIYKVINDNCSYPKGWAVVSFTPQIPAKGVPVTLLSFAEANMSAIDYSYTPSEDGYLCVTYQTSGADSRIYESKLTSTPTTAVLKDKVATLEKVAAKSSLILPPKFFAVVGYEFNIYWDTIYVTPDYGAGCPNYMVQAVCNIGANNQRSFRVTPTASQAGEHEITIQVYGVNGSLIDEKTSTLVVINPSAITISNPKNILSLGDSTIDDTGYMIRNLYSSIADLGFVNKILPIGTRGFVGSRHEARTGYTYKGYLTTYKTCKIYVSNLSEIVASVNELNVSPHPVFKNPNNSSRIWISDINVAEGWMTADNNVLTNGWSGTLQSYNTNVVNVAAVVTNVVNNVDNIVLYKNNTVDFANYMASVYGDADKTIDILTMANGINDCRGALKNQGQIDEIVDNAKAIIDAFLSYNPNGKVLIALPKIKASTLIEVYPSSYTLNSYNLRKKINEVFSSYDERVIVFGEVCGMDRFWGYPISEKAVAARIPEKITYNGDAVHPRNEGYLQIADTYLGALLYACKD